MSAVVIGDAVPGRVDSPPPPPDREVPSPSGIVRNIGDDAADITY